jgi:hypothetical protein
MEAKLEGISEEKLEATLGAIPGANPVAIPG